MALLSAKLLGLFIHDCIIVVIASNLLYHWESLLPRQKPAMLEIK